MKKIYAAALILGGAVPLAGTWTEYPVSLPPNVTTITAVSVNASGHGYAATGGPYEFTGPLMYLENGGWQNLQAPPQLMVRLSAAADDTLYAKDSGATGFVWRYRPGGSWQITGLAPTYGFDRFTGVAAVNANSWWATAEGTGGDGVVYCGAGQGPRVWNLGDTVTNSHNIVCPRGANPSGECYVVMKVWAFSYNSYRWALYVLKPTGQYDVYWIPLENYYCDGLAAYQPGEVRLTMTPNGAGSGTILMKWSNGVFTQLQTFPDRVILQCYPSPSEGWGTTYGPKVYHWSDAGFTDSETLNGTVKDLDMVSVSDGWAVGSYGSGSNAVPKMWHYTLGAAVAPTSLGRVKAAFK